VAVAPAPGRGPAASLPGRWQAAKPEQSLGEVRAASRVPEEGSTPRREEGEWVDVVILADPNAEMHVRDRMLRLAGRAGIGYRVAFRNGRTTTDAQRAEMREGGLHSVRRRDRDGEAVRRHRTGERHLARSRGPHRRRVAYGDVHAPVLTRLVLVIADGEATEHCAIYRPRPRGGRRRPAQG